MGKEIVVAGGGVAGLRAAACLAELGADVTLVEPDICRDLRSWFVIADKLPNDVIREINGGRIMTHKLKDIQFYLFQDSETLVGKYGTDLNGAHDGSFLMVDQKDLENYLRRQALVNGVNFCLDRVKYLDYLHDDRFTVTLERERLKGIEAVIDATGPVSYLHRYSHPKQVIDDNPYLMWICGARVNGEFDGTKMIFPLDNKIGKVSWIAPWGEDIADVIASDYCRLNDLNRKLPEFRERFKALTELCQKKGICGIGRDREPIIGWIRVMPIREPDFSHPLYALGDAAGHACPNMAEGLPIAISQAGYLARELLSDSPPPPKEYHRRWLRQSRWTYMLGLAFLIKRINSERAGANSIFYKQIADQDPDIQKRLLIQRRPSLADLPLVVSQACLHPMVGIELMKLVYNVAMLKFNPVFRDRCYGN